MAFESNALVNLILKWSNFFLPLNISMRRLTFPVAQKHIVRINIWERSAFCLPSFKNLLPLLMQKRTFGHLLTSVPLNVCVWSSTYSTDDFYTLSKISVWSYLFISFNIGKNVQQLPNYIMQTNKKKFSSML